MPTITSLHRPSQFTADIDLPSLTHLTIPGVNDLAADPLIRRFGPQLVALDADSDYRMPLAWTNILRMMQDMPKLQELVVSSHRISDWLEGDETPPDIVNPSLIHLGITGYDIGTRQLSQLLEKVLGLRWPSLRCLRIMPRGRSTPVWQEVAKFKERFREIDLALEDEHGRDVFTL